MFMVESFCHSLLHAERWSNSEEPTAKVGARLRWRILAFVKKSLMAPLERLGIERDAKTRALGD